MNDDNGKENYQVTFMPSGRLVKVASGVSVIKAARLAGVHINASCGGSGVCGKCRIILENGTLTGGKSEKLTDGEYEEGYRQACIATIESNVTLRVPAESELGTGAMSAEVPIRHQARMHVFNIDELKQKGVFVPPIEKRVLHLAEPTHDDNMADARRIIQGLKNEHNERGMITTLPVLKKMRAALREKDFVVTVTLSRAVSKNGKTHIVNIQPGDVSNRSYGLAFDIGTTTVHGVLVDHLTGKLLSRKADYNSQISYGEDVISRIVHAEKPKGLKLMHELVTNTINSLIDKLLKNTDVDRNGITSITLSGNTTMTHFLLGLEPHNIRRAPYVPVSTFFPPIRARDIDLNLPLRAVALVYPSISSYVGGDIIAGVMGSGMYSTDLVTLYIDIGTNAEIVVGNREWLVCAACSAGPAFEGGGITHGMRAAAGAIEDFGLNPATYEPMNITLGNKPPIGICGSGLLVIVATLFEYGVIDRQGKFNRELETERIREGRSGYEYVLTWEQEAGGDSDIVINEVDIENFIRAKAAIYAGCKTLIEGVGLQVTDLEQIILAGAFGSFIDLDSAMTVGLLPEVDPERILYVGNGSLLGSWMSEMSNHIRRDVVEVVKNMTSFELSEVTDFKDQYIGSLFLPHTDISLFPETSARLKKTE
jgi:uncharacterized 2Fe-2S/4Fe-4S cluster protein (DUF4445 family)